MAKNNLVNKVDTGDVYISIFDSLERSINLNEKFLDFINSKGLLSDFREFESKQRGIIGW